MEDRNIYITIDHLDDFECTSILKPGDRLDIDAQVLSFKRGLCRGSVKATVGGVLVAEMDNTIIIPEIFNQFKPRR